jgi:hypothetical protein
MIAISPQSKLAIAGVTTFLVLSACGAASDATGMTRTDRAATAASEVVSPAGGSSLQDMKDLYALKKQVAAFRRGQATVSRLRCHALDQSSHATTRTTGCRRP